jgi:hypothetical protein
LANYRDALTVELPEVKLNESPVFGDKKFTEDWALVELGREKVDW